MAINLIKVTLQECTQHIQIFMYTYTLQKAANTGLLEAKSAANKLILMVNHINTCT